MSSSAKKGPLGLSQKSDKHDSGGGSKGDSVSSTISKSKQGVAKKSGGASSNKGGNEASVTNPALLGQQALEALYSATYVEDFIECNDNMADDLIRQTTRMFEMGSNYMTYIRELEAAMAILLGDDDGDPISSDNLNPDKKKAVFRLQQILMKAQDTGDDSLQVMQGIQDHIENKTRQLDVDRKNLAEFCKEQDTPETPFKDPPPPTAERNIKRARRVRHEIYRPSILGPASLKATSYPETVSSTSRDHHETHVVTSSRSRDRDRDRDRDSQTHTTSQSTGPTVAQTSSADASNTSSSEDQQPPPPPQKTNGRSSERSGGSSSRTSATSAATDHGSSTTEKARESSGSGYTSSSTKKQAQKAQTQEKKTKKRKAKQSSGNSNSKDDNSPQQYAIDPDEPTYCLCDQVSYGEMIGCDNDLCPIEWFHFSCVSLTTKPKGKWYCPKCRGDRPNVMKPKAIFLKELEKYNREKEEKA